MYAAFLSHYKLEAASDARYLHDVLQVMLRLLTIYHLLRSTYYSRRAASDAASTYYLQVMLRSPVYLDSSSLKDLRQLLDGGVANSDVVVLMLTKGPFPPPRPVPTP